MATSHTSSDILNEVNISGSALITGASGFIGGRLRDALLAKGVKVIALRRPDSPLPKNTSDRFISVASSYRDIETLVSVLKDHTPDYVFHVAGATNGVTYKDFTDANVMPTQNLALAVERSGVNIKRFVHVSSLAACGPATSEMLASGKLRSESDPPRPIEYYGKSKRKAELVLESTRAFPWTIVRPGGVYGPGDREYFLLFKSAIKQHIDLYFGNEERAWSGIYVDDCVRGIVMSALTAASNHQGYFLCDSWPTTWGKFQKQIVRISNSKVVTLRLPGAVLHIAALGGELLTKIDKKPHLFNKQKALMGVQEAWTCSGEKATQDFGFTAAIDHPEGIKRTIAWYQTNGWL